MTTKTLLAVDGNSLVHRSFHALVGSNLRTRDGRPSWAVKGFLSQLLGAIERVGGCDALIVGFDDHTGSVRKEQWPFYKATRKEKPIELGQQLAGTIEMLRAAGVHVVVPDGLEADDVLASAAAHATSVGWRTVIVTSDRDSFALINDTTSVLRIITGGVQASPILTPERLVLMYGVASSQYREYAAMRGDTSDNLAGIAGVGEKTAAKLLTHFGSVADAFADVDTNNGALVAATLGKAAVGKLAKPENREAFLRNCEIMTMRTDLDLGLDLTAGSGAGMLPLDEATVTTALSGWELNSLIKQAGTVLSGAYRAPAPVHDEPAPYAGGTAEPNWTDGGDYLPAEPPAEEYERTGPVRVLAHATAAAMPGSQAARPATWDDSLF